MNKLRRDEALQELASASAQSYVQIETSLDLVRSRWAALREHYLGFGAEDTEAEVNLILAQTEKLLGQLSEWQDCCQPHLVSDKEEN